MGVDLSLIKTNTTLKDWKSKTDFDNESFGYDYDRPEAGIKDPEIFWWNGKHNLNISEFFEKLANGKFVDLMFLTDEDLEAFKYYVEELQEHAKNCEGVLDAIKKAKEEGYNIFYKRF